VNLNSRHRYLDKNCFWAYLLKAREKVAGDFFNTILTNISVPTFYFLLLVSVDFCLFFSFLLNTPSTTFLPCFYFLQMMRFMSLTNTLSSTSFFSQDPCIRAIQLDPNNHNLIACLSFILFPAADTRLSWTHIFILREQLIER